MQQWPFIFFVDHGALMAPSVLEDGKPDVRITQCELTFASRPILDYEAGKKAIEETYTSLRA